MSIKYLYNGVEQTDTTTRLKGMLTSVTSAADGSSVNVSEWSINDPTGVLSYIQLQDFAVEETTCPRPRVFTGKIFNIKWTRGPYLTGPGRVWTFSVNDANGLLHWQILRGAISIRGPESRDTRMAWLLSELDGLIYDNGLVAPNPLPADAASYRDMYADDVLGDLVGDGSVDGRLFFAYWDQDAEQPSLFYDAPTAVTFTSPLRLSSVPGDEDDIDDPDAATFYTHPNPELSGAGEEIYCGVVVVGTGVRVYLHAAGTHTTFFGSSTNHREALYTNTRIGKLQTAVNRGNAFLREHAGQRDTITCTVKLPAAKLNLIDAGMRISCKFVTFPGYDDFTWLRVTRRTLLPFDQTSAYFDVQLELSNRVLTGPGGGDPGDFPHQPPGPAEYVQERGNDAGTVIFDNAPTDGHLMTLFAASRQSNITGITPTGWTMLTSASSGSGISSRYAAAYYKIAAGDDATVEPFSSIPEISIHVFEWADGVSIDTAVGTYGSISTQTAPGTLASVSVTPSAISTLIGNLLVGSNDINAIDVVPGSGVTQLWYSAATGFSPRSWVGIKTEQTGASNVPAALTGTNGWGGITYAVHAAGAGEPPDPAQPVPWAVVTMDGADGTTEFPYAAGSLQLRLNGVPISTASFTERDPSCGDFTLSWVPFADDVITASYQGAA